MIIGTLVFCGIILMIDNVIQNSSWAEHKRKQAEEEGKRRADFIMKMIDKNVEQRIEIWKETGLPPDKWKL